MCSNTQTDLNPPKSRLIYTFLCNPKIHTFYLRISITACFYFFSVGWPFGEVQHTALILPNKNLLLVIDFQSSFEHQKSNTTLERQEYK